MRFRIERCFGMLVSPGNNVRHVDMQLLEKVVMATSASGSVIITGTWDPRESAFASLNKETTPEEPSVFMTAAADLVVSQIAEPIRFVFETRAAIYPQTERYWFYALRSLHRQYSVQLKRKSKGDDSSSSDGCAFELVDIKISEEMEVKQPSSSLTLQLANSMASYVRFPGSNNNLEEPASPVGEWGAESSGDDEPLLSGFGEVSKDCTNSELLSWSQVLQEWNSNKLPSKQLAILVKKGIPEALRGEVWQRLTQTSELQDNIVETYKILNTKDSPDEKVILRDIHRTFPAHDFFKKEGGVGQEALYRISKAYSVYDSEVGYCQGQSFLIAALLLQMPEEQAFGVLVKIMHDLGLRNIFRENFEELQMRLYQLDKLVEATLPDLWNHFAKVGLESHMYASQWFLTLFTAKFPLFLVFRVIDVFLYFGFESIFQVALGILKLSRKEMLSLDFEGLMKYFRVNIPKRYRSEDHARYLMAVAMNIKLKKLRKYENEWKTFKEAERAREDPVVRYERENKRLLSDNLRLDTENDNLARQLVSSKVLMRKEIDFLEDSKDEFEKEIRYLRQNMDEISEDKKRLEEETENLKTVLKRELEKLERDLEKKNRVVDDYKLICSQLSEKLELAQSKALDGQSSPPSCGSDSNSEDSIESTYEKRIRELELELAKTKLALVETECKNQDLTHQYNATLQDLNSNAVKSGTWLSKTITSLRETTVRGSTTAGGASSSNIKKSTSVDIIN
ncbi:rab GTPase-activating protein 1 [Lepeophtheirus salmonis]|uniref:rab GTPase-activating protein 1 n=1 Tax=Lepeophtheirus salmonis TaxID=72036 RepID=UPI001AEA8F4E|nr:rab GTPase-activating protein 1-like [Lepeophtheirus salmonis]